MLHRKDLNVRSAEPSWSCCSPNSYNTHTSRVNTVNTHPIYTSLNQIQDKSHRMVSSPYYQRNPQTPASSESSWATRKASASKKIFYTSKNQRHIYSFLYSNCLLLSNNYTHQIKCSNSKFYSSLKVAMTLTMNIIRGFQDCMKLPESTEDKHLQKKRFLVFRCIQ